MKSIIEKKEDVVCEEHDIMWMKSRWYGIFPSTVNGVCSKCHKNFKLIKKGGKEYVEAIP